MNKMQYSTQQKIQPRQTQSLQIDQVPAHTEV